MVSRSVPGVNDKTLYGASSFQVVRFDQRPVRKFRGLPRGFLREDWKYEENSHRRSEPALQPHSPTLSVLDIRKISASNWNHA